jgi:hypothetical protein
MKLSFRSVAILSTLGFFTLALIWMFAPNVILSSWGVAFSYPVGLMGRRAAAFYFGIAVMLFSARNAEPSPARSALVAGLVVACLTLATLGVFELTTGHASRAISVAAVIEVALSLSFLSVSRARKTRF